MLINFCMKSRSKLFRDIFRLMNHYESLVNEIEAEAKTFREDNQSLRENLAAIIAENNRLKTQGDSNDPLGAFRNDFILVSDRIYNNLRTQIHAVNKVEDGEKIRNFIHLQLF